MWKTAGSRLPEMTYRTSFIRISPWPAVKFVTRAPASAAPSAADADECSDSGSMNRRGVPHRFVAPFATAAWKIAAIVVDGVIGYAQAISARRVSIDAIASEPSRIAGVPG